MTLVALSGSYGAGGSRVGPTVARSLGVPFVDRAIPVAVARRLEVPVADADAHDGHGWSGWLERLLSGFAGGDQAAPAPLPADSPLAEDFCRETEEVLLRQAATGEGVILGRAAVIVLCERPEVLRVRIDGPREARIEQAMELEGVDRATATERALQLDRAHAAYALRFYGVDLRDPALYHLMIDSTAVDLGACAEQICLAARSLRGRRVRAAAGD